MFCRQCGKEIIGEGVYCNHCGSKINESINNSNIEKLNLKIIENIKKDLKEKKFNIKTAVCGVIVLAVIGIIIALFLLNNNSIVTSNGNTTSNIANGGKATSNGDWIYYSNGFNKMFKMKKDGSQEVTVENKEISGYDYVNVVGDWIYYSEMKVNMSITNEEDSTLFTLCKMKLDGSQKTKLEETKQGCYEYLTVAGEWLYYIDRNVKEFKDYAIYKMKVDGSNKTKLASSENSDYYYLNVVGDWIYYRESDLGYKLGKSALCKMKTDGSNKTKLTEPNAENYAYLSVTKDWIYYVSHEALYKMKTDGSNKTKVENSDVKYYYSFNVVGDWIYYVGRTNSAGKTLIYKMKTDGSNNTKVTSTEKQYYNNLNVVGDWIFYDSGNDFCKMKIDGSMDTKIE